MIATLYIVFLLLPSWIWGIILGVRIVTANEDRLGFDGNIDDQIQINIELDKEKMKELTLEIAGELALNIAGEMISRGLS